MTLTRFAVGDTELAGQLIPADAGIECLVAGANRDPSTLDDPDRFHIYRANAGDHLTFGYGRHHCLGAHLARLEAVAFIDALLDRVPAGFVFAEPDPPPPHGHKFRRPPWLAVSW